MAWSLNNYETYVYSVQDLSSHIQSSSLIFIRRGKSWAEVKGSIAFGLDIILEVREVLYFTSENVIQKYSYVVKKESTILYWSDSQSHPDASDLQSTHPHHKHIPPDIKHHRIPAPGLSFKEPYLTFIIHEIEKQFFASSE
jgi:hypothetical protein